MMRQGLTARPQRAQKYQEPHAPLDGITGDTVSLGSSALAGLVRMERLAFEQRGRRRVGVSILHDFTAATPSAATACSTAPGEVEMVLN
jgi:hypothetical protein